MEVLKCIVLLLVAVVAQVYVALGSPVSSEENGEMWNLENWQGVSPGALDLLEEVVKRSRAQQQFHGLMGRSTGTKGEMFVGLMGRRSLLRGMESLPRFY
ncbi:hypothetical protein NHX12_016333 [Muraenolepis orangiensis]|uniref:Uncharacterized protein n=1 Tax=Muraenolepis orangiensis TaxID=630683 RepID=A0A9Q0D7Z7_9TELE|nr:hypothetical protein NHX12_016333 [Muraenolepis orangiensis]